MYDDLSRIERCYGSVAEYNRSRAEDEAHEWELQQERNERCKANEQKLKDNKDITVWFAYDCVNCEHYEEVGPQFWNPMTMDIDDIEHGLCHNCNRKDCLVWRERNGE
jgi:hypothetical protein